MSATKDGKTGKAGYPLRLPAEKKAAADDGMSLNEWLGKRGDQGLAEKRERDAKAQAIKELEQQRDAVWEEIVSLLGDLSQAAAAKRKNHLSELCTLYGWDYDHLKPEVEGDKVNPDISTGKGRFQIESEAAAVLDYHISHRDPTAIAKTRLENLLNEHDQLSDEIQRGRGLDGAREHADRKHADRHANLKPESGYPEDDDEDEEYDDGAGDYYEEGQDDGGDQQD